MSFFKDLLDSVSNFLAAPADRVPQMTNRPAESAPAVAASSVVGERAVLKLKGYFDLAKEEIDKALRAEEWGLAEDAVAHYRNAQRVMLEAKAVRVPDALATREQNQVRTYQEKISKWQRQVAERLQILAQRAGQTSKENISSHTLDRPDLAIVPYSLKPKQKFPQIRYSHQRTVIRKKDSENQKPVQEAGSSHDARLVEMINTAIVDKSPAIKWDDVAGLDKAKQSLMEMVILPTKRRDLFTGLRKPARGLLLFGPPGNGKTMLAKAVASESEATFFNVSASSLTSKWVGEAEKLVRTLFMIAIEKQPSVIFIDEIDSILSTRVANENDASRRLKSEFLVQFDGVTSNQNDLVIVIGATNKPQELDDAVLRRLVKRIYVPLPDENVRKLLLKNRLKGQAYALPSRDVERLAKETDGYSGSDLQALCEEAAMAPIRELGPRILTVKANQVRPLRYEDFRKAMSVIRPSLQKDKWEELERWNTQFGSS